MKLKFKIMIVFIIVIIAAIVIYITNYSTQFTAVLPELEVPTFETTKELVGADIEDDAEQIEVAKQNGVTMYIDPVTTNIILKNNDGKIIAQTLPGFADDDNTQSEIKSPVMVEYKLDSFSTPAKMYGYDDSILKDNYTIDLLDNGVKVTYSLGASTITDNMIPTYIEKDMYENQILPKLDADQKALLKIYYQYSPSMEAYTKLGTVNPNKIQDVYNSIYTVGGFTADDLEASNEKFDVEVEEAQEPIGFTIPLVYTLDLEGNLNVQIPLNEVIVSGVNQVISIDLLPGLLSTTDGHFLVPDGSGAIIDTTTPKTTKVYSKPFTNIDEEIVGNQVDLVTDNLTLPIFANDNVIGFINHGAEMSTLKVELIGEYKLIYPSINMQYSTFYNFSDTAASAGINLTSNMVDGTYDITYKINQEDQTFYDYVNQTKDYYMNQFNLKESAIDPTLYLYVLGAYEYTDYFAGVPYTEMATLTTAEDVEAMYEQLSNIENVKVIYDGWNKNGLNSSILDTDASKENGDVEKLVTDYPGTAFAVNLARISSSFSDGFNLNVDGAYGVDGQIAERYSILNSSFKENPDKAPYYYLAPQYLESAVTKFIANFDYGTNIFIKDLGTLGYASFDEDNSALPMETEQVIANVIAQLKEAGMQIGMNNPVLTRGFMADYIVGLPTTNSGDTIFDYTVPFTQLVYSGLISNANQSINLSKSGNIKSEVLHAFETKSSIMFTVSQKDSSNLKGTDFDNFYSSNFEYWINTINQVTDEYKVFLEQIDNSQIVNDEIIQNGVNVVTYENGKKVAFNYTDVSVDVDGTTVEPLSYKMVGGE